MMNYFSIIIVTTFVLVGCQTGEKQSSNDSETITHLDTSEDVYDDPCTRGVPEPLMKKEKLPNSSFRLSKNNRSGLEVATLPNEDTLKIRNWGCEYYVLTYQFITNRVKADTNDLEFWFKQSKILLTGTLGFVDAPLNVKKGIMHLGYYIHNVTNDSNKKLTLKEEIDFDGDVIREFISVDRIAKRKENEYLVEISVAMGPL